MPTSVTMPQLGESVTEGVIARWLKKVGDPVDRDEPIAEIITDKVNAEMPSPFRGALARIVAEEGATVPVGGEICQIEELSAVPAAAGAPAMSTPGLAFADREPAHEGAAPDATRDGTRTTDAARANGASDGPEERRRYSPVVKRLAQEHDIDLAAVGGTGLSGRVTKDDVLSYIAARQPGEARTAPAASRGLVVPAMDATARSTDASVAVHPPVEPALSPAVSESAPAMDADRAVPPAATLVSVPTLPPAVELGPSGPAVPTASPPPPPASASQPPRPTPAVAASAGADEEYLPLTPMRKAIAEHMVRSKTTAPHATTTIEVDMTRLVRWRERNKELVKARHGVDVTYLPLVMGAVVAALKDFPILNASWGEDRIILKRRINVGIAVGLDDGLLVPVIHDADERNTVGLARAVVDLTARARAGRLTLQDMQGGTFTLNNTGVFGAIVTTPVINQPQAAILAMNAIVKRPVVIEDDAIAVRSIMTLSLSFDHRIVDGLTAGRFNQRVAQYIDRINVEWLVASD